MGMVQAGFAQDLWLVEIAPNQDVGTDPATLLPDPGYASVKLPGINQQAITDYEQGIQTWKSLAPGFLNVPVNVVLRGNTITMGIDVGGLMQSTDGGATWRAISYGVEGGFDNQVVVDFDVSPTNEQVMVVGGRGGFFRTEDGGIHWEHVTQGLPRPQFQNYSIWYGQTKFNADGSRVFAAIGSLWNYDTQLLPDSVKAAHPAKEVYVSRDAGKTFKTYEIEGQAISSAKRIFAHPSNPNIVYFSFKDGTFLATFNALSDNITFKRIALPPGYFVRDMTIDPLDESYMALALSKTGSSPLVYVSTNCTDEAMGIQAAPKPSGLYNDIISIAFNPQKPTQLVIGEGNNNALWVSENRGATYARVEVPVSLRHDSLTEFYGRAQTLYTGATSGFSVVASSVGAWVTRDNFATFEDLTMTYDGTYLGNKGVGSPANINAIATCSNAVYFSAQDHGLFRSKDGDHTLWEDLTGTDNWYKFPVQEVPWGTYTWMHKVEKVFASDDDSCVIFNALKYLSDETVFKKEKKFFRTRDQGANWDDITAGFGLGDIFPGGNELVKMLFNPSDSDEIWALFTDSLYRSTNGGDSFQRLDSALFPDFGSIGAVFSDIAYDPSHNLLYLSVGNNDSIFSRQLSLDAKPAALYTSSDHGASWGIMNAGQYSIKSLGVAGNGSLVLGTSVANGQPARLVTIPYGESFQEGHVKLTLGDTTNEIAACQLKFSPISVDGRYVLAYANSSWVVSDRRIPQGPYLSKNYGESFEFIQQDLPLKFIWSQGLKNGKVLLGTTFGLMEYDIANPSLPGRVYGVSARVDTNGFLNLSWGAVSNAYSYTVRRALSEVGPYEMVRANVPTNAYADGSAVFEPAYYYTVAAENSAGEGYSSSPIRVATARVVAGWDHTANPYSTGGRVADHAAEGISANMQLSSINGAYKDDWSFRKGGSTDQTFGLFAGASTNNPTDYNLGANIALKAGVYVDFTLTNGWTNDYELGSFRFDALRQYTSSGAFSASILPGGGITEGTLPVPSLPALGSAPPDAGVDYNDVDISLAGLADHRLGAGESVTFRIQIDGSSGALVDNIAITAIPALEGYGRWATGWGVDIGAGEYDFDKDGLSNLGEYGLGGDPTNSENRGEVPVARVLEMGGSNFFSYVYPRLKDPQSGLDYSLDLSTNLVAGDWTNAGYTVVGTNVGAGIMDYVSNATTTVEGRKYIRLHIREI